MRRSAYDEFVARGTPLRILYEREGLGATSGRALWRTRTPLVRFVVVSGAGHFITDQSGEAVTKELLAHLASHASG